MSSWTHAVEGEHWTRSWPLVLSALPGGGPKAVQEVWLVLTIHRQHGSFSQRYGFRAEATVRSRAQTVGGTLTLGLYVSLEEAQRESLELLQALGMGFVKAAEPKPAEPAIPSTTKDPV